MRISFFTTAVSVILTLIINRLNSSSKSCDIITETLCVNQINDDGFGDETNRYAFSMDVFKGSLYVGTLNSLNASGIELFVWGLPFSSNGAQIWKGDRDIMNNTWEWNPILTKGNGNINNFGVRKLLVAGDYLYAVTANHLNGCEVWRTNDGHNWKILISNGFGDDENKSGRGLIAYSGYIYVGVENRKTGAKIWRHSITESGDFKNESIWQQVVHDGLGDTDNLWFSDFVKYKGYLYVGTLNLKGMQLWRTLNGTHYEKIFDEGNGAFMNSAVMKLYVYNDRLYIGTMNLGFGASLWINIDDDGTVFETVFKHGNGNWKNKYVWYMHEYMHRLYIGTFKMGVGAAFDLYSCGDDALDELIVETDNGFGNKGHYGTRSMAVYDEMLMIGSATAEKGSGCKVFQTEATV